MYDSTGTLIGPAIFEPVESGNSAAGSGTITEVLLKLQKGIVVAVPVTAAGYPSEYCMNTGINGAAIFGESDSQGGYMTTSPDAQITIGPNNEGVNGGFPPWIDDTSGNGGWAQAVVSQGNVFYADTTQTPTNGVLTCAVCFSASAPQEGFQSCGPGPATFSVSRETLPLLESALPSAANIPFTIH
jgi:hypothetical protein